jgi:hypothetical protein
MFSYKSHELNLFSNDDNHKFKIKDNKGNASGFGANQNCAYISYSDVATGNSSHPIVIDALHYNFGGPVGVAWKFSVVDIAMSDEVARASGVEAVLRSDVDEHYTEMSTAVYDEAVRATNVELGINNALASEISTRQTEIYNANAAITAEASTSRAAELIHNNAIAQLNLDVPAEAKLARSAELKLTQNLAAEIKTRGDAGVAEALVRADADSKMAADIANLSSGSTAAIQFEKSRAETEESKLQSQISSLLANTDAVALNSLAELVSDYSQNNTTIQARVTYLEGVIAELVAKVL